MKAVLAVLAVVGGLGGVLEAQVSAPGPRDSIYALRVDPAAYQGHDYVYLLDEGVVRVESDGRSSFTVRQVAQVLTPDGVDTWGEFSFWHYPARQRVRINWMRVIGQDGAVLRDGAVHQQETAPPVEPGAPVYSDRRALQATLGGVAPGTLVDYSYTLETIQPWLPGDFQYYWYLNGYTPIRRSRFTLDAPADLVLRVRETNLGSGARDVVIGGRRIRTWATADQAAVVSESFAGWPNDVMMAVVVGGGLAWQDIGRWYDPLIRDRYQLTPAILNAHAAELRGERTLDDSLRATYRWVAQDFRYVSLSLGDGGYQPRLPRDVFQTRFGDCKDKTTLFVSLARRMGVEAYPVLVNADGDVDSLLPSLKAFDHMIAAVARRGRVDYLDVTSPLTPYGELPPLLHDDVGVALTAGGAKVVVLPAAPPESNRSEEEIVGSLLTDGRFVGRITISVAGTEQYDLREQFENVHQQDSTTRNATLRDYAVSVFSTAVVDSARYMDGRDLTARPTVTVWFTASRVVGHMGGKYYFNLPLTRFTGTSALSRLEAEGPRRFPIDVAQVNSPSVYRSSLEFELPHGWRADVPAAVSVRGAFGYYRADYRQVGRTLRMAREMGGRRGLEPPDSVGALRSWLKGVADDRTTLIGLNRGTGPALVTETPRGEGKGSPDVLGLLPEVVLRVEDLGADGKLVNEGEERREGASLTGLASTEPVESYHREFAAEQMVFAVGGSRMMALQVTAGAYRSSAEASRPLSVMELIEMKAFLGAFLGRLGGEQASLGASRSVSLGGVGDLAAASVFEVATPVAKFDLAMMFLVRGRVGLTVVAVGPAGLQDGDLAGLLRTMDQRIQERRGYLADLEPGPTGERGRAEADSGLAANTSLPLDTVPVPLPDSGGLTVRRAAFARDNAMPKYTLVVDGKGPTFPFGRSRAISVEMHVTLHDAAARAVKQVVAAETGDPNRLVRALLGEFLALTDSVASGDSTVVEVVAAPRVGERSVAVRARLRGMIRADMDAVIFARGRLSAAVIATYRPGGGGDLNAAVAVAQEMLVRMRTVEPGVREAAAPVALVDALRRVVRAERVVDSLVDLRDFDGVFRTIDGARLTRAPVGFDASTWNSVCWWGSLYGHAKRALPACEAAVSPDTTDMPRRDSRGLGRALAGDLEGAKEDFAYVVAHTTNGDFLAKRTAWLDALRAGNNPFTPQVLEQLKRQE